MWKNRGLPDDRVLEEDLRFQVSAAEQPVPGACVILKLIMGLKNDVTMMVGPTDEQGSLFVSLEEIFAHMDKITADSPMDYRPSTWTRRVDARVMSAADGGRFEQTSATSSTSGSTSS
jgi:hypothetical protein